MTNDLPCAICREPVKWKGLCKKHYYDNYKLINQEKLKKYSAEWRLKNLDKLNIQAKQWYKNNKEKVIKGTADNYKKRYIQNPELMKQRGCDYARQHRIKNKIAILKHEQQFRREHKDTLNFKARMFYQKNKELVKQRKRIRKENNIQFYLRDILRARVSTAIKRVGVVKSKRTLELIGCSVEDCRQYIEKQFKDGMNWKNHGLWGWHIDHIIPICNFDLTKKEEQEKCFHYTNLQPLWAYDNLSKPRYNLEVTVND